MGIRNDLLFTEALDLVQKLVETDDPQLIADLTDEIASHKDLAHICLSLLAIKAKGIDVHTKTGVELANAKPTVDDLIIPPHLERFRK